MINFPISLTFECLIRAIVAIFIRMRQQAQFSVGLLDLRIRSGPLQSQNFVKCRGGASSHSDHRRLLLDCIFSILVSLVMIPIFGACIWCCIGTGSG